MRTRGLIAEISGLLNIRSTGREILEALAESREGLLVSEIIERIGRSERAVRAHLKKLLKIRLIRRKKVFTQGGKCAYCYIIAHARELVKSTRAEVAKQLQRLGSYL